MKKFITKHWQWIIPIIISLVVAIPSFLPLIKNKEISLYVGNTTALINSQQTNLRLMLNDKMLKNPFITEIKLANTGDTPLNKQDFQENLEIGCDKYNTIISASIKESYPESLTIKRDIINNKLEIKPFLLNQGEHFVLQIITDGYEDPGFKYTARFSGFDTEVIEEKNRNMKLDHWISLLMLFILTSAGHLANYSYTKSKGSENYIFKEKLLELCSLVIMITSMLYFGYLYFYLDGFYKVILIPAAFFIPTLTLKQIFLSIQTKEIEIKKGA